MTDEITFTFRTTPELREWLNKKAVADDRKIGYIVRKILTAAYQAEQSPPDILFHKP